jgi:phage gpG-like protein
MASRITTRIEAGRVILAIRSPTYTLHAGGTTTRSGQPRMPARPILPTHETGASKAALDRIVEDFADYAIGTRSTAARGRGGR